MDRLVTAARNRNIQVLGILHGTPAWAAASVGSNIPANASDFANFARQVAIHYSPIGVHHWEIWNEPNLTGFFSPIDVVKYTYLLKTAYPAIKEGDPEAYVISAGLSPVPSNGPEYVSAIEFMEGIYTNGGKNFFDGVGFHPYSWPDLPSSTEPWNGWRIMVGNSTSIRSLMEANGDTHKKIWVTEYGAPTNDVGESNQVLMMT